MASGHNSMVEYQLPKLGVAGSIPVARSVFYMPQRHKENSGKKRTKHGSI